MAMDERPEEAEREKRRGRNTKESRKNEAGAGGAGEPLLGLIGNSAAHPEVTGLYIVHIMSCMLFYESRTHKSIDISLCTASQRT